MGAATESKHLAEFTVSEAWYTKDRSGKPSRPSSLNAFGEEIISASRSPLVCSSFMEVDIICVHFKLSYTMYARFFLRVEHLKWQKTKPERTEKSKQKTINLSDVIFSASSALTMRWCIPHSIRLFLSLKSDRWKLRDGNWWSWDKIFINLASQPRSELFSLSLPRELRKFFLFPPTQASEQQIKL